MKIYFIPGMGADHRVFTYVRLPEGYEPFYIQWIDPLRRESLGDYAARLLQQIDTTQPFVLAGVSMGGMLCVEIAKLVRPVCTVLISSVPVSAHLPKMYRLAGKLGLDRLVPAALLKFAAIVKHSLLMYPHRDRRLMRQIIRDTDDRFLYWSLRTILEWKNEWVPQPLYHIHGKRDEVLPCRLTTPTHVVKKGGHMIVVSRPETVNAFLGEVLPTLR
ncbi:MAG TPA: alpha/beta hydrolase [Puia sp.]|nr:alpha/beta hydrolase [Puia sp.]